MKNNSSIKPYCSNIIMISVLTGNSVKSNFEPSKGGNGIRLKNAKITFQRITIISKEKKMELNDPETAAESSIQSLWATAIMIADLTAAESVRNLAANAAMRAITILESGPPSATMAGPHFWFLRLYGLYGTGLAQPKANPVEISIRNGTIIEPQISICLIGLKFNLPEYLAVESPSQRAT